VTGAKIPWVTDLPETAALYAVCNRHYGEAQRIIRHDMTFDERARYASQLQCLLDLVTTAPPTTPDGADQ
jgi:hypothetical protein